MDPNGALASAGKPRQASGASTRRQEVTPRTEWLQPARHRCASSPWHGNRRLLLRACRGGSAALSDSRSTPPARQPGSCWPCS